MRRESFLSLLQLWLGVHSTKAYKLPSVPLFVRNMGSTQSSRNKPRMQLSAMENSKMLHVVYRTGNMDNALKFYTDVLGMQVLRKRDIPEEKYTNAFAGYGPEGLGDHFSIELTYNYGVERYNLGDGFVGMGVVLPSLDDVLEKAKSVGIGEIVQEPTEVEFGPAMIPDEPVETKTTKRIMMLADPDGYKFEVTEGTRRDPMAKVICRVVDIDEAIEFYTKTLGMTLYEKRSRLPAKPQITALVGYGNQDEGAGVELVYDYDTNSVDLGDGYGQIAISADDVYAAAEQITASGVKITRDPGPVPGIGTKITACRDTDGYKTVIVDSQDLLKELE